MLRARMTFGHNSFVLNEHLDTVGVVDRTKVQDTVIVDERDLDVGFREGRDVYHLGTGGQLGRAHKGFTSLRLRGRILVPDATQDGKRTDRELALRAAFDPELCYQDSPTTDGAYALDFSRPTTDTATYPSGWIPLRYWMRPSGSPQIAERLNDGGKLDFALGLVAADPRCYEQTEQTLVLTPGSASGNVLNRGNVRAPLKVTFLMSGAGAANVFLTVGSVTLQLNLSTTTAGQSVVVVNETCAPYGVGRKITKAGSDAFSLKTSNPGTWLYVPPSTTAVTLTGTTNLTSCTLSWYSARA